MKIHLKSILTAKWRIVLAASTMTIVIIGAVLVYLFAIRHASDTTSSIRPPEIRPSHAAAKPRQSPIRNRVRVVTPVNVVHDVFKGYELNRNTDAENQIAEEQATSQVNGSTKAAHEEMAVQLPQAEKAEKQLPAETKQETMKGKEAKPGEPLQDVSAAQSGRSAGKENASVVGSVVQDEGVKHLSERLDEARLSEAGRQKMIQSYLELRKVLPEKEAQKMIMWKIVHEK